MKDRRTVSSTSRAMVSASFSMGDDAAAGFGNHRAAFQQIAQRGGAGDQGGGVAVEQREEFLLARHHGLEKSQHGSLGRHKSVAGTTA